MVFSDLPGTADAVVVGGGTVGAWCACFLRQAGLSQVVLLEKGMLGQGASSRAAGVVRMQGGTPEAVRLGRWSREFYLRQHAELGCDSGFVAQGYLLPCFTEAEVAAARDRMAMQTSLGVAVRWRPEEGGLLFGMSNPDEPPGENRRIDLDYLALMRKRLADLVPVTAGLGLRRLWAATIDFTPDHLPIIGPATGPAGTLAGVTVACAGGAGMMWGPAVSRAAADVALTGTTDVVDVSVLGLDRFDEAGHSSLAADPVALPFPQALLDQQPARPPQAPPSPPAVSSPQEQPFPPAPGIQRIRALPQAQAAARSALPAPEPAR